MPTYHYYMNNFSTYYCSVSCNVCVHVSVGTCMRVINPDRSRDFHASKLGLCIILGVLYVYICTKKGYLTEL